MNESIDRTIRKFNPGIFQSDEELIEQFVVRKREFDIVLETLSGNIDSKSCQHVLVVAPRGRGKTMLLARVAVELRFDDKLSRCLLPVRFMEENQEIFNMADFWLETLFYLARENATRDPDFSRELQEAHAALSSRWREETLEEHARAAVLDAAGRLGKKLVLMVENFQALCQNVDKDFGWKLRSVLQLEPQIILLATATSHFRGLNNVQQPFFELFRIVALEPLAIDECRRLWQVVSGEAVSKREIRPLQILTGGSPRLLVIVAAFARHRSLRRLMEELVTLIDDHTEYFRNHLEVLGRTERRVYVAVIDLWQPSSTGEIAARARMDVRTVSTMLGRLVSRGSVASNGTGRKRSYVATERLYSIYYKLRRERDEAAVVQNLIHFMIVFYSEAELAEMSGQLRREAAESTAIREGIERAIAELPHLGDTFSGRPWPDIKRTLNRALAIDEGWVDHQLRKKINAALEERELESVIETVDQALASREAGSSQISESFIAEILHAKADAFEKLGDFEGAIAAYNEVVERFGDREKSELQWWVALALIRKGDAAGDLGEFKAAIAAYDEAIERFGASGDSGIQWCIAMALIDRGSAHEKLGDFEEAIATYDEAIERFGASGDPHLQSSVAKALVRKGDQQGDLGEYEAAIATYDEVIERFGTSTESDHQKWVAMALVAKGRAQGKLGDSETAIAAYDEVIERFGTSGESDLQWWVAVALVDKGSAHGELGDFEAAIVAYDEVVERFGASEESGLRWRVATALVDKGSAQGELGDSEAAIVAYDEVVERFGASEESDLRWRVATALVNKGIEQGKLDNFEAAITAYDEAIERFGASGESGLQWWVAYALVDKGRAQEVLSDFEQAIAAYDEVVERFGASGESDLQWWVAYALVDKGRVQEVLSDFEQAIAVYDEVVERFGASEESDLQLWVATALFNKGTKEIEIRRAEEAMHTCEELERRLGTLSLVKEESEFRWRARCLRTKALLIQEKHRFAMDAFRSAYSEFVPDNRTMLHEMIRLVPDLIATGASVLDLVDILSSDRTKLGKIAPLVIALRQYGGEVVRAPAEMLEVAEDFRNRIAQRVSLNSSQ